MAYDEELAARVRALMSERADVTEKRMFGGLAFLIGGNMAVAASGQGGLMVRLEPSETGAALDEPGTRTMEMRGRAMKGWIRIDDAVLGDDDVLSSWVERGSAYAAGLPAK